MISLLNSKIDTFSKESIFRFDENLINFDKFSINIKKDKSLDKFDVDSNSITRNLVCDEIIQSIIKESKLHLIKSDIKYLDYSYLESDDIDFLPPKETGEIVQNIIDFGSKNIICGSLTSTIFMDNFKFIGDSNTKSGSIYKVGYIENANLIIDSYIRYNDSSIHLFDNISFNIVFDNIEESEDYIKVDYRISLNIEGSKYIKVLINTKSSDYSIYNISKRKTKLNKI